MILFVGSVLKWRSNGIGAGACVFPFSLSSELENGRLFPGRPFDTWKTRAGTSAKIVVNTNAVIMVVFLYLVYVCSYVVCH